MERLESRLSGSKRRAVLIVNERRETVERDKIQPPTRAARRVRVAWYARREMIGGSALSEESFDVRRAVLDVVRLVRRDTRTVFLRNASGFSGQGRRSPLTNEEASKDLTAFSGRTGFLLGV